jgi:hypothetical protein
MSSTARPRCTRGSYCYHVRYLHSEQPPTVSREGDLCERCARENQGAVRSSNNPRWMDEVLEAIQEVRVHKVGDSEVGTASIWDLFELDDTPRYGRPSDLGQALDLSAKTLAKLRDWLDDHTEEALQHYEEPRCTNLYGTVRTLAGLRPLPGDPPFPEEGDTSLPLEVVAYTRSGRSVDETIALRLASLRQEPRFFSERDLEKKLGVPRSTIRHMIKRMDEIGFSLKSFTADELSYVALGAPRGRKRDS